MKIELTDKYENSMVRQYSLKINDSYICCIAELLVSGYVSMNGKKYKTIKNAVLKAIENNFDDFEIE